MSCDKIRLKLNSPTGKPVVLFASHQIDLSSLQDLKDTKPKPIFLYHNGINHFHALVPQHPSKGLSCTIL